jgi:hypothetical protein
MAGFTLAQADDVLKTFYLPKLREQLNNETPFFKDLKVLEDNITGKNTTFPLHIGRNTGITSLSDGGALPTAGNQQYVEAIIPMKYQAGAIRLTDQTIEAMKNDRGSFIRAIESEMSGLVKDMRKDIMRQIWGYGEGRMGVVLSATSGAGTITVEYIATAGATGTRFINVGDVLESRDATTYALIQTDFTVSNVVASTGVITVTGTDPLIASTAPGTILVKKGSFAGSAANSASKEIMGINTFVGTGNRLAEGTGIQAILASAQSTWKSVVTTSVGTLSELKMANVLNQLEINGASTEDIRIYTSHQVREAYSALLEDMRRYNNVKELYGGQLALMFRDVPVMVDIHLHRVDEMYFLDMNNIGLFRQKDFDWMNREGTTLKWDPGYAAWVAYMTWYADLGGYRRNTSGKMTGITIS